MLLRKFEPKELSPIVDYPVQAVEPAPEYDFIIVLLGGQLAREDPVNVYTHQDHIRVEGPGKNEWTKYPMTSIAYYGLQERGPQWDSSGEGPR